MQAAIWADQMMFSEVELASFVAPLVVTCWASSGGAGSAAVFRRPAVACRFADVREYDLLATDLARRFHQRRIVEGQREGLLGGPDISSLC